MVTAFSFASDDKPELYAAFLAALVGLPGLLWTLPRAARPPVPGRRAVGAQPPSAQ